MVCNFQDDIPSWWIEGSLLLAVNIGYDESGSGDVLLVSMQIGVVQKATKLHTRWKEELRKAGIPYFHSKDYRNYSGGVFRNLTNPQRESLLATLSGLVRQRLLVGATGKVTVSNFNAKAGHDIRSRWGSAYSFAVQMLVLYTRLYLDDCKLGPDVNILIEEGHKNANQALQAIQHGKTRGEVAPLNIMTCGLGAKKDWPILQAADMLAYSEWQRLIKGDRAIFDALHVKESRYESAFLDLDQNLVDPAITIAQQMDAKRKAWGAKRTKTPS